MQSIVKFRELSRYITKGDIRHYFKAVALLPIVALNNKVLQDIDDLIHCTDDG